MSVTREQLHVGSASPDCRTRPAVALFPGSFKPPHQGHLNAIRYLLDRPQVDRVVVIVANRCRLLPGTHCALDARSAAHLLELMLRFSGIPTDRVRIEIAEHRAVSHALNYLAQATPDESFRFCLGAKDFSETDHRFSAVASLGEARGVAAGIEVLPPSMGDWQATQLRLLLARGHLGRMEFMQAMPSSWTNAQKAAVWTACITSVRPIAELVNAKLVATMRETFPVTHNGLRVIDRRAVDPVFELQDRHSRLAVKYAGDTTGATEFGDSAKQQPARRLAVECRVIRYLECHLQRSFQLPKILFFDRAKKISVLEEQPRNARLMSSVLSAGDNVSQDAARTGRYLARLHLCDATDRYFWGNVEQDRSIWNACIRRLAANCSETLRTWRVADLAHKLTEHATARTGRTIAHLNFQPENVWQANGQLGLRNFERATGVGDPAFDVATWAAACIAAAIALGSSINVAAALENFISAYRCEHAKTDESFDDALNLYVACLLAARCSGMSVKARCDPLARFAMQLSRDVAHQRRPIQPALLLARVSR